MEAPRSRLREVRGSADTGCESGNELVIDKVLSKWSRGRHPLSLAPLTERTWHGREVRKDEKREPRVRSCSSRIASTPTPAPEKRSALGPGGARGRSPRYSSPFPRREGGRGDGPTRAATATPTPCEVPAPGSARTPRRLARNTFPGSPAMTTDAGGMLVPITKHHMWDVGDKFGAGCGCDPLFSTYPTRSIATPGRAPERRKRQPLSPREYETATHEMPLLRSPVQQGDRLPHGRVRHPSPPQVRGV